MKTIRANSIVSETSRDQEVPQNPLKRFGWKGAKRIAAAISVWLIVAGSHSRATDFDAYGPDKSGKTDVSSLLQKAVADAMASDKLLQIAPGKYWVASPVLLDRCNGLTIASLNPYSAKSVVLQGVSAEAEEREKKEKAKPVDPSRTPDKEEKKPNDPLEAQKESKSSKRTPIFEVKQGVWELSVAGITFANAQAGIYGDPRGVAVAYFRNCHFTNCDYGVKGDPIQIATFERCAFNLCRYGIRGRSPKERLDRSNLVNIYDCKFARCSEFAVQIEGSPVNLRDCDFEGSPGGAIELLDIMVSTIEGCYFEANGTSGKHPLIRISPHRLPERWNGQLNLRGNQFNSNDSQSLVYVAKGAKLHAHDNAVGIWQSKKGQVFVKQEVEEDKSVRIGENIIWDLSAP